MKKFIVLIFTLLASFTASAKTYTFDDLPAPGADGNLIFTYDNLAFDGFGVPANRYGQIGYIDPTPFLTPGVDYTGFNKNIIFNPYGYQAPNSTIIKLQNLGAFDFIGGFWSAGVTGDVKISFEGYKNGQYLFGSDEYLLQRDVVTPITLNWFGIDYLNIRSSAAIWVADNLQINAKELSPVPVPAAAWLFGSALLGFVGFRRKSV